MVKKNEIIDLYIKEVKFPNKGLAYVDDKEITVKNAIKDQKVRARITKNKKDKVEAKILEVIEKSPIEVDSECTHFGKCGGCSYQTLPYEEQLKLKQSQVKELLDSADIGDYEFLDIVPSPNKFEYRNKMEFTFGDVEKGGELALGMHEKGRFYEIVVVDDCKIVDEDFTSILTTILEYFREKKTPFYNKNRHEGILRHLVVRKAIKEKQILINLVTSSQGELQLDELVEKIKDLKLNSKLKGILHTINDGLSDTVQSDETRILYGQDYITEELLGLKFKISAFSFFQTNSLGAEKLYSVVRDFAGETKDKVVFDLYCGTGTIAQIVAPIAKKVYGIEIVEEAVERAKENAELNGLDNCEFIAGDVMEKVKELTEKPDIIILDPPRDGIHPKAIHKIIDFAPEEFVYVSCKPTSLARDLPVFIERGYKVEKVQCVDMFPMTPHVESVILLHRKSI
ncbi:23S rRNA (uracil-5-)-methyltransferase RumA [Gottschalkia acidurici 9a]|uniref:23S rRNA (Uracil-5-)-methyltransferase RumA n=1 Tax=Gottschalkia acidurici (strain ATCC 7906 / DSM 604 / BCRC 14475 / CIP 104303 / KCTC 5404 / NCIMB 10678 / 9a) TaxID=1128398 RepID=K0AUH1_GOTA9|nr:23S rRNA (uracil(1939)-C(5))-methyltransferase RlmD [Gottschalkia acidurici]AFS77508.1 23S rRNA (uracil-5-)-methyltransferase RumA [Gottschalkia acidurici 9a]